MPNLTTHLIRLPRLVAPALVGLLVAGLSGAPTASAGVTYPTNAAMVLQNITLQDLIDNKHGICNRGFTHVMKNAAGPSNSRNYLNAAQACGLKVIFFFGETANHSTGTVYPARVAYWVNIVKDHPALFGYLSVKEPSWVGISATEIRSLYRAFHAADPAHPVIALFGDIPHFGQSVNYYGGGMADIVMVDWYPVETGNGGRSLTGTTFLTTGPKWLSKVRSVVNTRTPGTPMWLMVQTHKYLKPTYHKKQRPSESLLRRQVRDGFAYLGATGIAFHTWTNSSYSIDQRRDPAMVTYMKRIADQVLAGTFQ